MNFNSQYESVKEEKGLTNSDDSLLTTGPIVIQLDMQVEVA